MREEHNSSASMKQKKTRYQYPERLTSDSSSDNASKLSHVKKTHQHAQVRDTRNRILWILGSLLIVEIATALLTSPVFAIRKIQISGLNALTEVEANNTRRSVQITPGTNWITAPNSRILQAVTVLPWIRSASVNRSLPTNITIRTQARVPVLLLQSASELFEIDALGVPIRIARTEFMYRLPKVELVGWKSPSIGEPVRSLALETILEQLPHNNLDAAARIAKIQVDQSDNICLNMKDDLRINFGSWADWEQKMSLTQRLYRVEPNASNRFLSVNLSVPASPVCILKDRKHVSAAPSISDTTKL